MVPFKYTTCFLFFFRIASGQLIPAISGVLRKKEIDIILEEARLCEAKGAGITGGDPLCVIERTCEMITRLKKEFGKEFHIHLYTTPEEITKEKLEMLYSAGLDEIRFHPALKDKKDWEKIVLAKKYPWSIGIEIPVIPDFEKETKELLDFLDGKISFLNLNALEVADTETCKIIELGYETKDDESYGVLGSEELAFTLMKYVLSKKYNFRVHYCTSTLKDRAQMRQRIKRRAENTALETDKITDEGMLLRGALYLPDLKPGFGYRKKLEEIENRSAIVEELKKLRGKLIEEHAFKENEITLDEFKLRLLCSRRKAKKQKKKIKKAGLIAALTEEYPTKDGLEVEVNFL